MSAERAGHLARFGWQAVKAGSVDQACVALAEAVQLAPSTADYWAAYGVALTKALRFGDAVEAYRRSVALDSKNIFVWCNLAEVSLERSDYATAAVAIKRCMELDPKAEHPSGLRARALVRRAEKKLKIRPR